VRRPLAIGHRGGGFGFGDQALCAADEGVQDHGGDVGEQEPARGFA